MTRRVSDILAQAVRASQPQASGKRLERFTIGDPLLEGEPVALAGDHPTLVYEPNGTMTVNFAKEGNGRTCGDCQLCCKLVPVPAIEKPAGKRCQHARTGKGCMIYADRPFDCKSWSCRWLADRPNTEGMSRPDRAHFVIDLVPDYITVKFEPPDPRAGETQRVSVLQVWVDPAFPEVARGPELRGYMQRMAEQYGYPTLIRLNSRDAYCVFPPAITTGREWVEKSGNVTAHNEWERILLENWEVVTE